MQNSTNASKYGFSTTGMDIHMLKGSEWGIVAMLSQSKYGKYGNLSYEGINKEIYQNKSDTFITGSSNQTPSTSTLNEQVTYDTPSTGYGASTTGTIYGVYDMSGGANEYVMSNYKNYSGESTLVNSGFSGLNYDGSTTNGASWPEDKYYDLYTDITELEAYKAGDATYETYTWYDDSAAFLRLSGPWINRGGSYSSDGGNAGVFYYWRVIGNAGASHGFRLTIKP